MDSKNLSAELAQGHETQAPNQLDQVPSPYGAILELAAEAQNSAPRIIKTYEHTFKTPFGKTEVYGARPKYPDDNEVERVFVMPGFSETPTHCKDLVDRLADRGFRAATFSQPRRAGKEVSTAKDPIERQADVFLSQLEMVLLPDEKIHLVAHSLGAATALKAALKRPELFASLTLEEPLGLLEDPNFRGLIKGVSNKLVSNFQKASKGQSAEPEKTNEYRALVDSEPASQYTKRVISSLNAGNLVLGSQPWLALKEAWASSKYSIWEDLKAVGRKRVPIHIDIANGDQMFPGQNGKTVTTIVDDKEKVTYGNNETVDWQKMVVLLAKHNISVGSIADEEAGHDTFWMQPERTAEIVYQVLRNKAS